MERHKSRFTDREKIDGHRQTEKSRRTENIKTNREYKDKQRI